MVTVITVLAWIGATTEAMDLVLERYSNRLSPTLLFRLALQRGSLGVLELQPVRRADLSDSAILDA